MKHLQTDLNERHNERNALQRRLETIQTRFDALVERTLTSKTAGDSETEAEEDLLLPQEAEEKIIRSDWLNSRAIFWPA